MGMLSWFRRPAQAAPSFAELDDSGPALFDEIATSRDGRDVTKGWIHPGMIQPTSDEVLLARGADLKLYKEVLRDDQVKACFEQRRLAVVSAEWDVEAGGSKRADKQAADFIRAQLQALSWDAVTDMMLYGVFYGWAVAEALWMRDGAQVVLDDLKVRNRRRFGIDGEGRLRLITSNDFNGEVVPPAKFWTFQTGADNSNEPYGLGLGHWLYWPVFFKRNDIRFWLIFLEKFGMPTAVGKYPAGGTSEEERKRLLASLRAIQTDSGVIIPEGMSIELIEAARSGTADYTALYDRMNGAIAKVCLGQTMTTDDGSSMSQAKVHMEVRQDLIKADADVVCASFNRSVVRWLVDWNYPGAAYPKVWRDVSEPEDLKARSERDKNLFDIGFRPTLREVQDTYGGEWEEKQAEPASNMLDGNLRTGAAPVKDSLNTQQAEFANGDAQDTPDRLAERLAREAAPMVERGLVDPLRKALDKALAEGKSLAEFSEQIPSLFSAMDARDLADLMGQAMMVADLAGRLELRDGGESNG
jgi:phage gp29-like protein